MNRNEKLEGMIWEWLDDKDLDTLDTKGKAGVLKAAAQLQRAVKDVRCKAYFEREILPIADKAAKGGAGLAEYDLANFSLGSAFYAGASQTAEETCAAAAKKTAEQLFVQPKNAQGIFTNLQNQVHLGESARSLVFYMQYETQNGGKEHYNDIIGQFNALREHYYADAAKKLSSDVRAVKEVVDYCAALIDTMEAVDQPVYEVFRRLRDLFKEVVSDMVAAGVFEQTDANALMASYAVLKGCRMKALHTEKYEGMALAVLQRAWAKQENTVQQAETDWITALVLCYSESVQNRAYQDYGRGKGGVLWS